ncbi:protein of unknown function [Rhodovastum atsumiense]|nr:protein of unknown function [Rhodovastum atsumiense]
MEYQFSRWKKCVPRRNTCVSKSCSSPRRWRMYTRPNRDSRHASLAFSSAVRSGDCMRGDWIPGHRNSRPRRQDRNRQGEDKLALPTAGVEPSVAAPSDGTGGRRMRHMQITSAYAAT